MDRHVSATPTGTATGALQGASQRLFDGAKFKGFLLNQTWSCLENEKVVCTRALSSSNQPW